MLVAENHKHNVPHRQPNVFLRQLYVTMAVTLNMMSNGCLIGYSAVIIPTLRDPSSRFRATEEQISWVASIQAISTIIANLASTPAMNILGRKKSHILSVLPLLAGWLLILFAKSVNLIILGRFIQGFSMGILMPVSSIIIGEMTDPRSRGPFLIFLSLALTVGVLITQTLGYFFSWHVIGIICFVQCFISLVLTMFPPESPSWLLSKGKIEECTRIFYWLRGHGTDEKRELESMIEAQTIAGMSSKIGKIYHFSKVKSEWFSYLKITLRKPEFYKPIVLMLHMNAMIQFSGVNVLVSYMTDILGIIVSPDAKVHTWMLSLNLIRFIANILAVYFMKRMKRRTLLGLTGSITVTMFIAQGLYVLAKENNKLPMDSVFIPIVLLGVYMFFVGFGYAGLAMVITGEIFPLEYRGLGGGVCGLVGSICFFLVVKLFPGLVVRIGMPCTYFLYGSVVVYCMVVVLLMLPETKDRTLQEIEDGFRGTKADDEVGQPLNVEMVVLDMK